MKGGRRNGPKRNLHEPQKSPPYPNNTGARKVNSLNMPKSWIKNTLRIYLWPNAALTALSLISLLMLSACASAPPVQVQCPKPAAPSQWAMQEPQPLMQELNKLISVSGEE